MKVYAFQADWGFAVPGTGNTAHPLVNLRGTVGKKQTPDLANQTNRLAPATPAI